MVLEAIKADTHGAIEWVYPKEEADKVIAELKKEKEYVIEHTAEVINMQERELRNQKRKRCLAMAEKCFESREYWRYRYEDWSDKGYNIAYKWRKVEFWGSWGRRWLEIADELKE